jgi:uncharacterized protein YbjQ (UPF0145 family)
MIGTNTETVSGHNIRQTLGLAQGNTVRAKNVGRDIAASFKNLVGGEVRSYSRMADRSKREAIRRSIKPVS